LRFSAPSADGLHRANGRGGIGLADLAGFAGARGQDDPLIELAPRLDLVRAAYRLCQPGSAGGRPRG